MFAKLWICVRQGSPEKHEEFLQVYIDYISQKVETATDNRRHVADGNNGDIVTHLSFPV